MKVFIHIWIQTYCADDFNIVKYHFNGKSFFWELVHKSLMYYRFLWRIRKCFIVRKYQFAK